MTTSIKEPIEAFQAGLWEVVPLSLLRLFSHAELELLLSGLPDIDVHDLRRNTAYAGGLSASDRLVQWFWSVVEDMGKQDVALLLQFVTGAAPGHAPPAPRSWHVQSASMSQAWPPERARRPTAQCRSHVCGVLWCDCFHARDVDTRTVDMRTGVWHAHVCSCVCHSYLLAMPACKRGCAV